AASHLRKAIELTEIRSERMFLSRKLQDCEERILQKAGPSGREGKSEPDQSELLFSMVDVLQACRMSKFYSRREMLRLTGQALAATTIPSLIPDFRENNPALTGKAGAIVDEKHGAEVGRRVLEDGGNAIDAMVAACLVTCIATPSRCGIGGY